MYIKTHIWQEKQIKEVETNRVFRPQLCNIIVHILKTTKFNYNEKKCDA